MWGTRQYLLAASGLALLLAVAWVLVFASGGSRALLFVAAGWAPIALIGVLGGALTVRFHGTIGVAFPLTLATCILLRLFLGLIGVALASINEQLAPYLTSLLGTFAVMQGFEVIWFFRRDRWFRSAETAAAN